MFISDFYHDCKRIYKTSQGNPILKLIKLAFIPSVHIMFVYRLGHFIVKLWPPFNWLFSILYFPLSIFIKVIYNTSIPARAEIGAGFVILHPGAIYIHPLAKIGKNVTTNYCVTIGAAKLSDKKYPVIGDEVMIGVGAKILGPIVVNHHSVIGANAVVLKDIPAYAVVGGVPAKVIKIHKPRKKRDKRYRNFRRNRNTNANIKHDRRSGAIHINDK